MNGPELDELKQRAARLADATSEAGARVREVAGQLWAHIEEDALGRPWFWALALLLLLLLMPDFNVHINIDADDIVLRYNSDDGEGEDKID
jgi:hypothetical protein